MNKIRVVIVGGGLAGLSTAESLLREHADQFDVTVLEAKRSTGGRAGSFRDPSSGETIDYCQHVAMGCCTNLLGLLNRYGLSDSMQRYSELRFLHPKHPQSHFAPIDWLPAPFHLAMTIGSLKYLTWAQHRSIRNGMLRLMRTNSDQLADKTAAKWLADNGQDADTIRDFWDVILVSALGESTEFVSMAWARKVMIDGFAVAKRASDVLVPTEPLGKLFGERLTDAIRQLGATIVPETSVTRVDADPIGVQTKNSGDGEADSEGFRHADHIVSAVPWHQVGKLLADSKIRESVANLDAIGDFPSSPITGLHLWFDREITDQPHHVLVGTTAQWILRDPIASPEPKPDDESQPDSKRDGFYYQVVISASREARAIPKDELVQKVQRELRQAFPATSAARLIRSQVVTDPQSVFSVRPEVEAIRPPSHTSLPWFHLAGDWIATGWPATMEGAVVSGILAANSVKKETGLSTIAIDPGLPRGWIAKQLIKS